MKSADYFDECPWGEILAKAVPAPYVPPLASLIDSSHFDKYPDSPEVAAPVDIPPGEFDGWEEFF